MYKNDFLTSQYVKISFITFLNSLQKQKPDMTWLTYRMGASFASGLWMRKHCKGF